MFDRIQFLNLATSVKTAYDFGSHGPLLPLGDEETSPRKYHLSPLLSNNPPPLSPLQGPSPFLPPAQNVLSEEIVKIAECDLKQVPSLTIGTSIVLGNSEFKMKWSLKPHPKIIKCQSHSKSIMRDDSYLQGYPAVQQHHSNHQKTPKHKVVEHIGNIPQESQQL